MIVIGVMIVGGVLSLVVFCIGYFCGYDNGFNQKTHTKGADTHE